MLVDITDKRFCIFGLQGSGKSVLVKYILRNISNSIVYDVLKEHRGFTRYLVTHRQVVRRTDPMDPAIQELNNFINQVVFKGNVRLFILEEANRYCPTKPVPLPAAVLDLNDFQRHEKIAFGAVCRRPVQLHTDLVELAHYLFIYNLAGKNDIQYLEDIAVGLGEAVNNLDEYCFVVVPPRRRDFFIHTPIEDFSGGKNQGENCR